MTQRQATAFVVACAAVCAAMFIVAWFFDPRLGQWGTECPVLCR